MDEKEFTQNIECQNRTSKFQLPQATKEIFLARIVVSEGKKPNFFSCIEIFRRNTFLSCPDLIQIT